MKLSRTVYLKCFCLVSLLTLFPLTFIVGCTGSTTVEKATPTQTSTQTQSEFQGPSPGMTHRVPNTPQEAEAHLNDWLAQYTDQVYSSNAPKTKEEKTAKIEEAERVGAPKADADLDSKFNQVREKQIKQFEKALMKKKYSSEDLKYATEYISRLKKERMPKIKLPKSDWLGAPTGIYNAKGGSDFVKRIDPGYPQGVL
jgi:hypothetical protein